jgi:Leucine-rich repeat (LRR) protein
VDSYIPLIRDLGSKFDNVTILWLSRCQIRELDGIASFTNLKELYISYNEISELEDLSRLEYLEVVDLEGNEIRSLDQVEYLSLCPLLRDVTLQGNPLEIPGIEGFEDEDKRQEMARKKILEILNVQVLDDVPVESTTSTTTSTSRPNTSYGRTSPNPLQRPSSSYGRSTDTSSTLTIGISN